MENIEKLSAEQVEDITKFAMGLAYASPASNFYSPFLSNQLLQNLNTVKVPSYDKIKEALADYTKSSENLKKYVEFASYFDMIFKRTLYSYVNALSFDLSYICTDAYTKEDYESKEYLADKRRVENFLLNFDYKKEFYNVVMNVMKSEYYYTWFRKTKPGNGKKMKYALQILPQDYCMVTGSWEKGYLFSMDMMYFIQPGVDLNTFDPSLKETFQRTFSSRTQEYIPSAPLDNRKGVYALWADVSPMNGAFCFKMDSSNFNNVPFLAPFTKNIAMNNEVESLQYNKDLISAYGILAGGIKLYDGAKSGEQKNQFAIDLKTLGQLLSIVKQGVGSQIKVAAMPTEDTRFYQFEDKNPNMYSNQVSSAAAAGTGISRVIYSSDRMSNAEIEAALNEVYSTMKPMYAQFNNFMDFYVNQMTKKYHFKFNFTGSNYRFEREARFEQLMKMADKGVVLPISEFASATGYNPVVFEKMLQESKWTGWINEYSQMMVNVNVANKGDSARGRPAGDSSDLTDSGEISRDNE